MEITTQVATVIAATSGALASFFTFLMGKRHEKKIELKKIKEEQYIDFLSTLAKAKVKEVREEINEELSIKIQTIYLVGSKDVQSKLEGFLNIFTEKDKVSKSQNELYGELIQAMKIDLYGRKWKISPKCINSLDNIKFTVFIEEK